MKLRTWKTRYQADTSVFWRVSPSRSMMWPYFICWRQQNAAQVVLIHFLIFRTKLLTAQRFWTMQPPPAALAVVRPVPALVLAFIRNMANDRMEREKLARGFYYTQVIL